MKALSAELSLAPLLDFDLTVSRSDELEPLGVAVGNIFGFCAKAVPPRPMQPMAKKPRTNRIFMENLSFIDFDTIKGAVNKGRANLIRAVVMSWP